MEIVKSASTTDQDSVDGRGGGAGLLAWLAAWRSSITERICDRDPTLWMHRDALR